jgi:hypothetical protein
VSPEVADRRATSYEETRDAPARLLTTRYSPLRIVLAVALLLLGAGAWALGEYFSKPPEAEALGSNLPVNIGASDPRDISAHNSPTLVANPVDPSNLAISNRVDSPRFSCALHLSFDGAASWGQTPIPVPRGEQPKCYAPDVAFGRDGTMYLSFVTLKGRGNVPNAVWLTTSSDGGRTLSAPSKILGPLAFQVRLTADPTIDDRLYLTWLQASGVSLYRFAETGNPINLARSDDGGETWQGPEQVSDPARERVVAPVFSIGPDSALYIAYLDLEEDKLDYDGAHEGRGGPPYPGAFSLVLARSVDSGATWNETVLSDTIVPSERFLAFLPPLPSLAVDHTSGEVYIAYHDARLGDSDVWMWKSSNGGESFSPPLRVNDTKERDGTTQRLPKLAVSPGGRLDVVYYDRRRDPDDVMTEVRLQSSFDHGISFTSSLPLSDAAFDSRIGFGSERDMAEAGSRLGLLSTDDHALAVWADTRRGTNVTRKQDLMRAIVAFEEPRTLPLPLERGMRYGGRIAVLAGVVLLLPRLRRTERASPAQDGPTETRLSDPPSA